MLMRTSKRRASPAASAPTPTHQLWASSKTLEELWLLGQPPLSRLLEFVEGAALDAAAIDRHALTDDWRAANDLYISLETTEADIANQGSHRELDASCVAMAEQVRSHPHFRRAFDTLPTTFEMVELDSLIICQRHGDTQLRRRAPQGDRLDAGRGRALSHVHAAERALAAGEDLQGRLASVHIQQQLDRFQV